MDVFPFTELEWQRLREASHAVLNATLADDAILRASHFTELRAVLEDLRARHGDHPILRETEADFTEDPLQQCSEYRAAIRVAEENSLPTLSIRISLARVLLEDLADPEQAAAELAACMPELGRTADESQKSEWFELMGKCRNRPGSSNHASGTV